MLLALLSGLAFGFFGSMPLAGPVAVLVFARGLDGDIRSGRAIAAGSAIAESGYAFLAYWGMSELVVRYPRVVLAFRAAAALILLALGAYLLIHRSAKMDGTPRELGMKSSFALGLGITALNPTFLATWTAAVAVLHSTGLVPPALRAAVPFALGAGVGIVSWFWLMLALMRRYKDRLRPSAITWAMGIVGVALLGMGGWAAVVFLRGLTGSGLPLR